jgi:enamine deaminase RidA (YjgF/YER057c/UK114 family)
VRVGPLVEVSGTTATGPDGVVLGGESLYEQARQALANLVAALDMAGAAPADVIRTRMYVTDISRWHDAARAHAEVFADFCPATSMLEVSGFIDPRMLFEVEATAWVGGGDESATSPPA